jgi:hypothetical protein
VELGWGRVRTARKWYARALEIDPTSRAGQTNTAISKGVLGELGGAFGDVNSILQLDPRDVHARAVLDDLVRTTLTHVLWLALAASAAVALLHGSPSPPRLMILVGAVRALAAVSQLTSDRHSVRSLPWSYMRSLPRRNRLLGLAAVALAVSLAATLVGAVVPQPASQACTTLAMVAAGIGILSSLARLLKH